MGDVFSKIQASKVKVWLIMGFYSNLGDKMLEKKVHAWL
jgi:hypothetical protein